MATTISFIITTSDGRRFRVVPDTLDTTNFRVGVVEESAAQPAPQSPSGPFYTSGPTPNGPYYFTSNGMEPNGAAGTYTDTETNILHRLVAERGCPQGCSSVALTAGGFTRTLSWGSSVPLTLRNGDAFDW